MAYPVQYQRRGKFQLMLIKYFLFYLSDMYKQNKIMIERLGCEF